MEAINTNKSEQETHTNHLVKAILLEAGVMYDGAMMTVDGKIVSDTPSAAALRLVEGGILNNVFIGQLRDAGLEV